MKPEEREVRRTYCGSTYWVRSAGRHGWYVTGDGVAVSHPAPYEQALAALDAVAPLEEVAPRRCDRCGSEIPATETILGPAHLHSDPACRMAQAEKASSPGAGGR